jgi:hypothetical protein
MVAATIRSWAARCRNHPAAGWPANSLTGLMGLTGLEGQRLRPRH